MRDGAVVDSNVRVDPHARGDNAVASTAFW